ncbi:MAG: nitroreductase family protein [Candidatus Glassbacteria bacterium]
MEFSELIFKRRSVRKYKKKPVEDEKLQKILEAMRIAPSAANRQPFVFYVVRDEETRLRMREVYDKEWFYTAPVILCGFVNQGKAWTRYDGKKYGEVDVTIAMDHLILAAANEGLGTCWVAAFKPDRLREILGAGDELEPVVITPLGYPDDGTRDTKRKPLEELVVFV